MQIASCADCATALIAKSVQASNSRNHLDQIESTHKEHIEEGPLKGPLEGGKLKKKSEFWMFDVFVEKLIL